MQIMRLFLLFVVLLGCLRSSSGQKSGSVFPEMQVSTAEGVEVNLPQDVLGKYTLLILAYSKKSEKDLLSWFEPIFYKFIQKTTGLMESFGYDVNVYFVPMFTGVKSTAAENVKRQASKKVDSGLLSHVLFYRGELKKYKEELNLNKGNTSYLFVLDETGKVVQVISGEYQEAKMDQIEEVIE